MYKENLSDDELGVWLAFHLMPKSQLGSRNLYMLLERYQFDALELWNASRADLISIDPANFSAALIDHFMALRQQHDPEKMLAEVRAKVPGVGVLAYGDWNFPSRLRHLSDGQAPLVLFYLGQLTPLSFNGVVAIVGTRNPTAYGQRLAKQTARGLAENGVNIASGLAIGIDSLAHWGAIEGGTKTIAVMATGPEICYPSSNKPLYRKIIAGDGLVITEYPPGVRPEKWQFPARNRIVSGISEAVVVVEAGEQSGALITASLADSESRTVFAFPGRADAPQSAGTNKLIRQLRAELVRSHEDILDTLGWVKARLQDTTTVVELYGREKEVYHLLEGETMHFDILCERSGIPLGELSAALTMLELAGLVTRMPGDWYSRADQRQTARKAPARPPV